MPKAGVTTVTTVGTLIYDDNGGCTKFWAAKTAASSFSLEIRVPALHGDNQWARVEDTTGLEFREGHCGIKEVYARGVDGAAEVKYSVTSVTLKHMV